jgi:hypothetical protein
LATSKNFQKAAKSKQSPNWKKSAHLGHREAGSADLPELEPDLCTYYPHYIKLSRA